MDQETHELLEEFDVLVAELTVLEKESNNLIRELAMRLGEDDKVKESLKTLIEEYKMEVVENLQFIEVTQATLDAIE